MGALNFTTPCIICEGGISPVLISSSLNNFKLPKIKKHRPNVEFYLNSYYRRRIGFIIINCVFIFIRLDI